MTCASWDPRWRRGRPARSTARAARSNGPAAGARPAPKRGARASAGSGGGGPDTLPSPLQGNMWKVLVKQGDTVTEGQLLCIIEAMKMENEITAHKSGTIVELPISEGAPIQAGAPIATIKSAEGSGSAPTVMCTRTTSRRTPALRRGADACDRKVPGIR